jgi:hypothetical protein
MRICVFALGLAVLAVGCSGGPDETQPAGQPSHAQSADTSTADSSSASEAEATGSAGGEPFEVYTHCGVESARIQGRWWHAEPPLYNEARSGPPAGWGDPHQKGTLRVESDARAVFEAKGQQVVFVPAPDNQPVRMCD